MARLKFQGNTAFLHELPASRDLTETLDMHEMDRFIARKRIVERMEVKGLLDKIEPTTHAVPRAERGDAIIEPWLTDQWYVNAEALAKRAIDVVESGETKFIPKNWEKTYFEWMRNIRALVHLASDLVGSSNSSVVRPKAGRAQRVALYRRQPRYLCGCD